MLQAYFDVGWPYDTQGGPWNRDTLYQVDPTLAQVHSERITQGHLVPGVPYPGFGPFREGNPRTPCSSEPYSGSGLFREGRPGRPCNRLTLYPGSGTLYQKRGKPFNSCNLPWLKDK